MKIQLPESALIKVRPIRDGVLIWTEMQPHCSAGPIQVTLRAGQSFAGRHFDEWAGMANAGGQVDRNWLQISA